MIDYNDLHLNSHVRYKILSLEWQYNFCKGLIDSHSVTCENQCRHGYATKRMIELATCDIGNELVVGRASSRRLSDYEEYEWNAMKRWLIQEDTFNSQASICTEIDLDKILENGLISYITEFEDKLDAVDRKVPENIIKANYYRSSIAALESMLVFADSFGNAAEEGINKTSNLKRKAELRAIRKNLLQVPRYGAKTLYQVLQAVHLITVTVSIRPYIIIKVKDIFRHLERHYNLDKKHKEKNFSKIETYIASFFKMQSKYNPLGFDAMRMLLERELETRTNLDEDDFWEVMRRAISTVKKSETKGYNLLMECGINTVEPFVDYNGFVSMSRINFVEFIKNVLGVNGNQTINLLVSFEDLRQRCIQSIGQVIDKILIDENTKILEGNNMYFHTMLSSLVPDSIESCRDVFQNNGGLKDIMLIFSDIDILIRLLLHIKRVVYDKQEVTYIEYCNMLKTKKLISNFNEDYTKEEYEEVAEDIHLNINKYCEKFKTAYGGKVIPYMAPDTSPDIII